MMPKEDIQELKEYLNEIEKYKKKTKSNVSKANKKSKHKHTIVECLFHIDSKDYFGRPYERYCHASYCGICGKVHNVKFFETEKVEGRASYRTLTNEEVLEKHKDLPIIEVENEWVGYIPIEVKNENT